MRVLRDLDALLVGFREGAFVVGADGYIARWNRGAERIIGYSAREVVGKACHEAFHGWDAGGHRVCHQTCRAVALMPGGGETPSFEVETRTKAGRLVWVSMRTLAARDPDGSDVTAHLFHDVTETHQLVGRIRNRLAAATAPAAAGAGLTPRETEVLRFLVSGVGTKAVADRLHVTHTTIRNHVQSILGKLGVHSRLEAVAYAHRHRLI